MQKILNRLNQVGGHRGGFTMLELVIVIAIMSVLSTVGFVSLSGFRGKQNLKKTTDELVAVIVGTQKRSISQDAGNRWNMRFSNTTSSGSQYIVFSGSSYATSAIDKIYGLNRNVIFSEPYSSSTFDAFFAPFTGTLPSKKIISLVDGKADGFVGDILMNTAGLVTSHQESGLIGYWHFDEDVTTTSTLTYDASGNGNNGTLTDGPTRTTAGEVYNGLSLDGLNDRVQGVTSNPFEYTGGGLTLSIFFNPNASDIDIGYLISKPWNGSGEYNYFIRLNANHTVTVNLQGATAWTLATTDTLSTGSWHHVVVTVDSAKNTSIYFDGLLSKQGTHTISNWTPTVGDLNVSVTLGCLYPFNSGWAGNTAFCVQGIIDEARIYNRALTATEVLNMYNDLK